MRIAVLAVTVLTAALFATRVVQIEGSLPYSLHFDERHLTERARDIMQTGDWNPHWFRYPCLPLYLTTGAMSAGLLRSAAEGGTKEIAEIGGVATPYYDDPTVVFPARVLFALLGTLSVALAAGLAWRASRSALAAVLAALFLAGSPLSHFHAWTYLNVDTVGTFFALLAVFHALRPPGGGLARDGLAAGALAGLAIGSKYSLFPILLPGLLRIGLDRDAGMGARNAGKGARNAGKGARAAVFLAAAAVTFLATTPGLLDLPSFLDGLAFEVHHYATGHGDATIEAGLPHLRAQLTTIRDDLGPLALLVALLGAVRAFRRDPRRAACLVVFPAVLLVYLAQQRVQFERNVLSVLPFVAVLAAIGAGAAFDFVRRPRPVASRPALAAVLGAAVVAVVLAAMPWGTIRRVHDPAPDSRRQAVEWIAAQVAEDVPVFVADELEVDVRPLGDRRVVPFSLFDPDVAAWAEVFGQARGAAILVPTRVPEEWRPHLDRVETVAVLGRTTVKETVPAPVRGTPHGSLLRPGGSPALRIGRLR